MDWTIEERYGIPIGTHCYMSYPKEVCLVSFTLHLSPFTRKQLYQSLHAQATLSPFRSSFWSLSDGSSI